MKTKYLWAVICIILFAVAATSLTIKDDKLSEYYGNVESFAPYEAKLLIANQIAVGSFATGIVQADSLINLYPNDPHIYVMKGFAYYAMGDSIKARDQFKDAMDAFDYLLSKQPAFQNVINKATMVFFVYGDSAHQKYWDDVSRKEEYVDYWWTIPEYRILTGIPLKKSVEGFIKQYTLIREADE